MSSRKVLDTWGRKRKPSYTRLIRETVGGTPYLRVLWKHPATRKLKTESFDDTKRGLAEARAFAEELHARLSGPAVKPALPAITLEQLWRKYRDANVDALAAKGFKTTEWRWRKFALYAKPDTLATDVTLETMDGFKRAMLEVSSSSNQVALALGVVRMVIRWGVVRDLIPPTKVTEYRAKFSKAIRLAAPKMAEYTREEATRILSALDPRDSRQWRAWVLVVLLAYCGPRVNAALHLEWRDIDLDAGTIHWRAATDKMGTDRVQPMPAAVRDAFYVALGWATWMEYSGRYVFFGVQERRQRKDEPWTYSAFISALHQAADRAKVPRLKWRAAHAFRRLVAGDVLEATGSTKRAAQYIGDKDVRIVEKHYVMERPEELRDIAEKIGGGKE